jgi:hypothetical protein
MEILDKVQNFHLTVRSISAAEAAPTQQDYNQLKKLPAAGRPRYPRLRRAKDLMDRYQRQSIEPYYETTMHALRLSDIAIVTNPFELHQDFGVQMKARSPAEQTFVVQLADRGACLPTAKAVAGGISERSRLATWWVRKAGRSWWTARWKRLNRWGKNSDRKWAS